MKGYRDLRDPRRVLYLRISEQDADMLGEVSAQVGEPEDRRRSPRSQVAIRAMRIGLGVLQQRLATAADTTSG